MDFPRLHCYVNLFLHPSQKLSTDLCSQSFYNLRVKTVPGARRHHTDFVQALLRLHRARHTFHEIPLEDQIDRHDRDHRDQNPGAQIAVIRSVFSNESHQAHRNRLQFIVVDDDRRQQVLIPGRQEVRDQ